jgi:hypothetical protein
MELPVTVKMLDGEKVLTAGEASIYSLAKRAIAGEKVAYVRSCHQIRMIEILDSIMRSGKGEADIEKSLVR